MTIDQIREFAVQLPDRAKGKLAGDILTSMAPPEYNVSDEEVLERTRELESGEVEDISFDELKRRLGR